MATTKETDEKGPYPFYIKATVILFGLILFFFSLYALADILIPVAFAFLIAILLNPFTNLLARKLPRPVAIFLSLLIAISVAAGIIYFLSTQIASFSESLPALKERSAALIKDLQQWVSQHFGVPIEKQAAMIKKAGESSNEYLGKTLNTLLGVTSVIVLIPIYVFFLLFYKTLILNFLFEVFSQKNSPQVAEILGETKTSIQSYIVGLLIETCIVSVLNSVALLILGVKSAILIGVIGGILNMIPYLGGIVAIALPLIMATVTKDGYSTQLAILGSYLLIQFIDNNILVPTIVSSKVKINALISILIVLLGGALWGLSGMFLSIPFIAIMKLIFDRVDGLKPWGKLLGDQVPKRHAGEKFQDKMKHLFDRKTA